MNYRISTISWGHWHLNIFLNWNLRSLSTYDNRKFFLNNKVCYKIYTKENDVLEIKKNHFFKKLSEICKCEIEIIDEIFTFNPIALHHKYWLISKNEADQKNEIMIFNPPDVLWSSNSFLNIEKLIKSGKKAIFMSFSRSIAESLLDDLDRLPKDYKFLANDLVKLSIKNMHPLTISYNFRSKIIPDHSEQIFSFHENGYSVSSLTRELFVLYPNFIQLSKLSLPINNVKEKFLHKCVDSEQIFAISFAPLFQCFDWYLGSKRNKILDICNWWITYNSTINNYIFKNTALFYFNKKKKPLPRELKEFMNKIIVGKEFLNFFYKLPFFPNFFIKTTLIDLIHNYFEKKILKEEKIFIFVTDYHIEKVLILISNACKKNLSKETIKDLENYLNKLSYRSLDDLTKKNSIKKKIDANIYSIYNLNLGNNKEIIFFYDNEILKIDNCEKYIFNLCKMKIPFLSYSKDRIDKNFIELEKLFSNFRNCYPSIVDKKENLDNLNKIKKYYQDKIHIIFNRIKDNSNRYSYKELFIDDKILIYFYNNKYYYTETKLFFSRNVILIGEKYYKIYPIIRDVITFLVTQKNIFVLKYFTPKDDVFFGQRLQKKTSFLKRSIFKLINLLFKKNFVSELKSGNRYKLLIKNDKKI